MLRRVRIRIRIQIRIHIGSVFVRLLTRNPDTYSEHGSRPGFKYSILPDTFSGKVNFGYNKIHILTKIILLTRRKPNIHQLTMVKIPKKEFLTKHKKQYCKDNT